MSGFNLTPPVIDDHQAIFTLATGEKVRVSIREGGLGTIGYRLNVNTDRALLVLPSSGNSIDLMTKRSLAAEEAESKQVVTARDAKKGGQ